MLKFSLKNILELLTLFRDSVENKSIKPEKTKGFDKESVCMSDDIKTQKLKKYRTKIEYLAIVNTSYINEISTVGDWWFGKPKTTYTLIKKQSKFPGLLYVDGKVNNKDKLLSYCLDDFLISRKDRGGRSGYESKIPSSSGVYAIYNTELPDDIKEISIKSVSYEQATIRTHMRCYISKHLEWGDK